MNTRLKEVRKHFGMNQEQFGIKLGVSNTAISKLEKGENGITEQMIKSICREFNVMEQWLRTGDGEPFIVADEILLSDQIRKYNLDELDRKIVEEYMKLAPEHRQIMRKYIMSIAKSLTSTSTAGFTTNPVEASDYEFTQDFDSMTEEDKKEVLYREYMKSHQEKTLSDSIPISQETKSKMA